MEYRLPESSDQATLSWYALYVRVRHEKAIAKQLAVRVPDVLLPTYETTHVWKTGKVKLQLPLFSGYLFVRLNLADRLRVLEVPGVVHFVQSGSRPLPVEDEVVDKLRRGLQEHQVLPHSELATGKRVRIRSGAFEGMEGVLVQIKNKHHVVISLDALPQAFAVEVGLEDVVPLATMRAGYQAHSPRSYYSA